MGSGLARRACCPFDCVRKRFSGFCRFYGFSGEGAAHKNMEAPRILDKRCPRIVIPTEVEESFSFAAYHRMSGGTQMGSLLSNFKVRGYGSGFAANIYEAMPESSMQVTSH